MNLDIFYDIHSTFVNSIRNVKHLQLYKSKVYVTRKKKKKKKLFSGPNHFV